MGVPCKTACCIPSPKVKKSWDSPGIQSTPCFEVANSPAWSLGAAVSYLVKRSWNSSPNPPQRLAPRSTRLASGNPSRTPYLFRWHPWRAPVVGKATASKQGISAPGISMKLPVHPLCSVWSEGLCTPRLSATVAYPGEPIHDPSPQSSWNGPDPGQCCCDGRIARCPRSAARGVCSS